MKARIDAAVPRKAQAKPKQPRRLLVSNLSMRDGKPVRGSSAATIPPGNYALQQMGRVAGAYEAVFSDDIEMFRPANIKQFDAICFNNTLGVLFDDPELRASLLGFVEGGKGFVGIHDAIATFVQYPKYDQWPEFGRMLGGTENGGHPWNGEVMTMRVEDPTSPINAAFGGKEFQIADQAFQLQEPALRDRLHVLLRIDAEKSGPPRRVLAARKEDMDFPMSWIRRHGKGRVFYSGLGHGPDVFSNPQMLQHLLAGIQYALGDLAADDSPDSTRRAAAPNLTVAEPMGPVENLSAYPVPPEGFNVARDNIPHGEVKLVEYDSKTLGIRRPLRVYTPPGYSAARRYPVLYLQHGLGNTSTEWVQRARAPIIADNLIAEGKMVPTIIVFPSGNATATPADEKQGDRTQASYGQPYHDDLLKEIIPFVEATYSVSTDRANRAIAGMSMGSGQALNIGLTNLDTFDWIAVVAPAPNTRAPAELLTDPAALNRLKLFWLSVGNRDALYRVAQSFHNLATEKGVTHIWRVDNNAHDTGAMSSNFYHFAQKLFK